MDFCFPKVGKQQHRLGIYFTNKKEKCIMPKPKYKRDSIFIVIFHAGPGNFLAEIIKLFPSNHLLKRADYEYDFAHDRSS